MNNDRTIGG